MHAQNNLQTNSFDDFFYSPTWDSPIARAAGYAGSVYGVGYLIGFAFKNITPHGAGCLAVVALGFEYVVQTIHKLACQTFGNQGTWSGGVLLIVFGELFAKYVGQAAEKIQNATHPLFTFFLAPVGTVTKIIQTEAYQGFSDWQKSNAMLKSLLTEPLGFIVGFIATSSTKAEFPLLYAITAVATLKLEAIAHEKLASDTTPTTRAKKLAVTLLPGLFVCTLVGGKAGLGSCLLAQLTAMRISRLISSH